MDRKRQQEQLMLPKECLAPSKVQNALELEVVGEAELTDLGDRGVELSPVESTTSVIARVINTNMTGSNCEEYRKLA